MSPQIAIIGLNQVGASIGLALREHKEKITRIGHDADTALMRKLEKEGVIDKTHASLKDAVRGADLVILSLPTDLLKDALGLTAGVITPDTVVICVSVIAKAVYEWAREVLPQKQPFIVLQPVLHPERLRDWEDNLSSVHANLFENCQMLVVTDTDTQGKAFQMANDLCALLKAKPYFTESMEADGIMARVEQLPKLSAVAMLSMLVEKPGWDDSRKMANRAFFRMASNSTLYDEQEYFGISSLMNKENITRALDDLIAALTELRDMINEEDEEGLRKVQKSARQGYETWYKQRVSGEWDKAEEMPEVLERGIINRLFGGKPDKKKTQG
ncbi:MAG TPA: prephenate dehydrogenase/arogenate dehydrogenase family protein [Anaerolineaceae bacterium]|nr:prephenate dehydrogenase/arogenate dehydrogenase family protein [Anaerolineaceae bacterium]